MSKLTLSGQAEAGCLVRTVPVRGWLEKAHRPPRNRGPAARRPNRGGPRHPFQATTTHSDSEENRRVVPDLILSKERTQ